MRTKKQKKSNNKLMLIGIMGLVLISLIGFVEMRYSDKLNNYKVKNE